MIAYGVTAVVVAAVLEILAMPGQAQYQALVSHGVHTSGQVVPDSGLRGGLGYSFVVDGRTYTRSGSFDYQGTIQLGDTVPVVYEESNPSNNCSCDPSQVLSEDRWSPILLAFWMSLIVPLGYVVLNRLRGRRDPWPFGNAKLHLRVGPASRFAWWCVSALVLWLFSAIARGLVQPEIYFFLVIALALIWFPAGVLLDRLLTPRLRAVWSHPRP